jgi:periplasmic copper chaperone A
MNKRRLIALLLTGCLAHLPAAEAHDYQLGALRIGHPWTRPTLPGQTTGGGYLSINNTGNAPDRLLGGSTFAAVTVEVHEMHMEGDVMRMREIKTLALPPGKVVTLAPGGLHLMLTGLKAPLRAGDVVPVKLRFERAGEVDVVFRVETKPASAASAAHTH